MSGSREKMRAILLSFVMVISIMGAGAAFTGSAAADADLGTYQQPDPANFDYAVTNDGNAPSEASGEFTDDESFTTVGAAVKEADDGSGSDSILVFSNTTEANIDQSGNISKSSTVGTDNPAVVIDGDVVDQVASYDGPGETTITFDGRPDDTASAVFDVNDGAEVRGLTIGGDWNQIGVVAGENATIESNVIEDSAITTDLLGTTVRAVGDNVTITNNEIQLSDDHTTSVDRADYVSGIGFFSAQDGVASDNTIVTTGADDGNLPARGVEIAGDSISTLEGNDFTSDIGTEVYYVVDLSEFRGDVTDNNQFDRAAQRTGDISLTSVSNSIDLAVSAASSGETIEVAAGTYNESVNIDTQNVTIESTGGAGATTIDATGSGDAVSINSEEVTVSNFTLVTDSTGVDVDADADADTGIVVSQNNIVDVSEGVNATDGSGTVDATSNWWEDWDSFRSIATYSPQYLQLIYRKTPDVYEYTRIHTEGRT